MGGFMEAQLAIYAAADRAWARTERSGKVFLEDQCQFFYGHVLQYGTFVGLKRTIECRSRGLHSDDAHFIYFDILERY